MRDSNRFKAQDHLRSRKQGALRRYQDFMVGSRRLGRLIVYELVQWTAIWVPGALGYFLRSKLVPLLLGECGRGCVFGRNFSIRNGPRIHLGNGVVIEDNAQLDGKGDDAGGGIFLRDGVFVGRGTILGTKGGVIECGENTNLGSNVQILTSNRVVVGRDVLVAAYGYLIGGGNYGYRRRDIPMSNQYDFEGKGGISIADDVWMGARATVLDGVSVGRGAILAAGAVVNSEVGEYEIFGGIPARQIGIRPESAENQN